MVVGHTVQGSVNSAWGTSFSAAAMKSIQMGSATRPPVSPSPSLRRFLSDPTQTPVTSDWVKPTNQAS